MYLNEHHGRFIRVGLAHAGAHADESNAWINTLKEYYGSSLLHRSPVDHSPHWPTSDGGDGVPVPGSAGQFRRSSYGVNNFLDPTVTPWGPDFDRDWPDHHFYHLNNTPNPSATAHFIIMAFEGEFAGADHPHVELWGDYKPWLEAGRQLQIAAHGGPDRGPDSISNYGFLDGHAETLGFNEAYSNIRTNKFDPAIAR
jgi:prepilin-type processing-associated H-X9-DG protein